MAQAQPYDPAAAVHALADHLISTIDIARALAKSGRTIDITGFDSQVGLLCAKSLDLQPDDGRRIRPLLIALSHAIEALSCVLAARAAPAD